MKKLLILEDDLRLGQSLQKDFIDDGFEVTHVSSIKEISAQSYDCALLDMRLGAGELGINVIEDLKKQNPQIRIVMMTGYGSVSFAVEAMKRGADDVVLKPIGFQELRGRVLGETSPLDAEMKRPTLSEVENEYIEYVLVENKGNISKTAKDLGLMRQSLQRKLKKHPR